MAGMNITTQQEGAPRYVQPPDIGVPIQIPVARLEEVALILRAVIALSDEFAGDEKYPTEADKAKNFVAITRNLQEVATFTREVISNEKQ